MPLQGTNYQEFRALVDKNYDALVKPTDCTESLPLTFTPMSPVAWHLRWYLEFTDGKYVRIAERYQNWPGLIGIAKRVNVAYHYGSVVRRSDDGLPGHLGSDQVDIRIDDSCAPIHLHFMAQNPHYANSSIEGLDLPDMDIFAFVNGIFKHRETKKSLDKIFKFKIR